MTTKIRLISIGITSLFCLIFGNMLQSQNVAINSTGAAPDASAMLDVSGSEVGILIPRMTQANRPGAPENSLLIYQTDNDPGYYYYDATIPAWVKLMSANDGGDKWDLEGNNGTNPNDNFVGTIDGADFAIRTSNTERLRITTSGQILQNNGGNTAGQPGYSFFNDQNTGMFGTLGNVLGFSTNGAERMRIASNGNVGIGTTAPSRRLHVNNSGGWKARFSGPDGYIDFGPNNSSWAHIYTDRPNFIFNRPVVSMNGFASYNADLTLSTNTSTERIRILQSNGNVGINTAAPAARLHVSQNTNTTAAQFNGITVGNSNWAAGEFYNPNTGNGTGVLGTAFYGVYGDVTTLAGWSGFFTWDTYVDWLFYQGATQVSDKRLKDNITLIEDNRDLIKKLTPVTYTKKRNSFKTDINSTTENNRTDNHSFVEYGFIAQDVENIFPELVKEKEMNVEGQGLLHVKGVNYIGLIPILTKAIQEQQEEIEDLEQRVEKLERLVNELMRK